MSVLEINTSGVQNQPLDRRVASEEVAVSLEAGSSLQTSEGDVVTLSFADKQNLSNSYNESQFEGDPTDEAKTYELRGRGYCREIVAFDTPINGIIKSKEDIVFNKASAKWKEVTHIGIFDEEFGGNLLFHGAISTPVLIVKNKNFFIKNGDLQVGFE